MEQLVSASLARQRFLLLLFGIFAAIALLLASIGIYGVLAYLTGQRTPEIGLRMALGATVRDVIGLVLRQCLQMVLAGLVAGIFAAIAVGRVLQRLVQGMQLQLPESSVRRSIARCSMKSRTQQKRRQTDLLPAGTSIGGQRHRPVRLRPESRQRETIHTTRPPTAHRQRLRESSIEGPVAPH